MADQKINPPEFDEITKALEDSDYGKAIELTSKNAKELVHTEDERGGELEERFQYKYRRFKKEGLTLLHYAALHDQDKMVEILLKHKADPLKPERRGAGNNSFHYACMFGGKGTIEQFLRSEHSEKLVNEGNHFTSKPLYYVAERRDLVLMKLLLENGADPNGKAEGERYKNSVLQFATKYSSTECIAELLRAKEGIEVNYCDGKRGQTALHMACEEDKLGVVKLLLDMDADITIPDFENRTALQVAIGRGAFKCAEILVEKHEITLKNGLQFLKEAIDQPKIVLNILTRHIEKQGRYSICLEQEKEEDRDIVHKIVESEAYSEEEFTEAVTKLGKNCIEYTDANGRTPIMVAAMLNKHRKLAILLDVYTGILMECLFTPDKPHYGYLYEDLLSKTDSGGLSAIHLAVICEGPDVDFDETVKVLNSLRKNERIGKYKDEKTPLLVLSRKTEHMKENDVSQQTAMHVAMDIGKPERALVLLKETEGEGVEMKDSTSSNVLHCAIEHKIQPALFKQLLNLGKTANTQIRRALEEKNNNGETALQLALKLHQSIHAEHLLSMDSPQQERQRRTILRKKSSITLYGLPPDETDGDKKFVDPNVKDENGRNVLRIAIENGAPIDLILKLLESGSDPTMYDNKKRLSVHVDKETDLQQLKAVLEHRHVQLKGLTVDSEYGKILLKAAIEAKRPDVIKFLLVKGAILDSFILTDVITTQGNEEFAMLLVRYSQDARNLMMQLRQKRGGNDTLFHELIKNMPDVAEEALNRSTDVDEDGKVNYCNTKLLLNETDEQEESSNQEHGLTEFELQEQDEDSVELGTQREHQHHEVSQEEASKPESTLICMVEHKQLKLLEHPAVKHILGQKWSTFGLPLYIAQLVAYCFLVAPQSMLVVLRLFLSEEDVGFRTTTYTLAGFTVALSSIHLLVLGVLLCHKFSKNPKDIKRVFLPIIKNFYNYLQGTVFILAIVFSIFTISNTATGGCCDAVTWHFGLLTTVCGWVYLIHLWSKMPFIGEQAIVFLDIVWTFLRLTLFALLLVLAATIILATTFFDAQALRSPFNTFGRGMVTVITMITGELDYGSIFGLSYDAINATTAEEENIRNIPYPETANLVWVIFLVFVPILLSNMLTGLAVGDVIEIQRNAALRKLEHQVTLVNSAEYYIQRGLEGNRCLGCIEKVQSAYEVFKRIVVDDDLGKREKEVQESLSSYNKKRQSELEEIRKSGNFSKDTRIAESIEDVREVAISCMKRLKEFKDTYDNTTKKLREDDEEMLLMIKDVKSMLRIKLLRGFSRRID